MDRAADIALTSAELRKHRGATQVRRASAMGPDQGAVSRTERQEDLFLSTLRGYVEALGGHLEIRAVFGAKNCGYAIERRLPSRSRRSRGSHARNLVN